MATKSPTLVTDHEEIERWIRERGGAPSVVRSTHTERGFGLLRVDYPGDDPDEGLEEIGWDEFFSIFDIERLALLHRDPESGESKSRFCKFVARE